MDKLALSAFFLIGVFSTQAISDPQQDILLLNHTGYVTTGIKKVVLQTGSDTLPNLFKIVNETGDTVYSGKFTIGGAVDSWHTGKAYSADFTIFETLGKFQVIVDFRGDTLKSRFFEISDTSLAEKSLALLLDGFESQHVIDPYNAKDKKMSFFGERNDFVNVEGGWYDASGEQGKYLSHLCFSNYMNPQQTPIFVWNVLEAASQYSGANPESKEKIKSRFLSEAAYGADFLVRMLDKEGYFYLTVFANWSGDPERREICAYVGQDGKRTADYKAGFREGAGVAIAALARAAKENISGNYDSAVYIAAAEKGFTHLLEKNGEYIDNGIENIIDDYCSLLAATELYAATRKGEYLEYARMRMRQLSGKLKSNGDFDNWWAVEEHSTRPFFHGADAGLPLIALGKYLEIETEESSRNMAITTIQKSVDFEIKITKNVHNPFGYPRQYVKAINENRNRAAFFLPHQNETGYWWQGENSRLASLAAAFYMTMPYLTKAQNVSAKEYAANNLNWIYGLNPYDVSMLEGVGYNNPEYIEPVNLNFRGGVCNGITAGFTDETDIAFMPLPQNEDSAQRWRWSEQWMPHAAWLMLAVSAEE